MDRVDTTINAPATDKPAPLKRRLLRPMLAMTGIVFTLVALIGGTKFVQITKIIAQSKVPEPPVVVTAMKAQLSDWRPEITAVGSTKAVRGVDVTTEAGGIVRTVAFKPGQDVAKDTVLVELNAEADIAQLRSLEATADLAETVLKRDRAQLAINAVAQAVVDSDEADLKAKRASAEQQRAVVQKKTVRAPFSGRIGITSVNPGQYLNPGDKIATLETVDPIYMDFTVPQEQLSAIAMGQLVAITADAFPEKSFSGRVTAIDTKVDQTTRNITVEATVPNPKKQLLPGMFARATVASGEPRKYLTVPQTAVTYNPYGATVFLAVTQKNGQQDVLTAQQNFVKTGPTRGDQVAIVSGVSEGDLVVTGGQMKLKSGSPVKVDNSVLPLNAASPTPQEQ
jgi:membrane fusion protein (multidrug efflux system)